VKSYFKSVVQFGTDPKQSHSLRSRVQLSNQLALCSGLLSIFLFAYFISKEGQEITAYSLIIVIIAMVLSLRLNKQGLITAGRLLVSLVPILGAILVPLASKIWEPELRSITYYFAPKIMLTAFLITPLILFEMKSQKERVIIFFLGVVTIAILDPLNDLFGVGIEMSIFHEANYADSTVLGLVAFSLAFFSFLFLHTKAVRYESQLVEATKEAKAAAKTKSEFLSKMSHEIRTPLNGVIGMTELLKLTKLDEEQREQLGVLQYSGKNLLSLVNDVLDFSKLEAGKIELESAEVNLKKFAESTLSQFSALAEKKGVELQLVFDENSPISIFTDSIRLGQVMNNLLSNALKLTFEMALQAHTIDKGEIMFKVSDTGVGIPEDKFELIFESFTQASNSTTREYGGTGLGLSISKSLVEKFGAELVVESEVGKGSSFYFNLPAKFVRPKIKVISNMDEGDIDLNGFKVLVAEDNDLNVLVSRGFLELWGAEVHVAANGLEAVEMAAKDHYDLILMDLHMPEMNGIDATKKIRGLDLDIPIIALTASTAGSDTTDLIDAGMNTVLQKPFDPADLQVQIARYIK
jgi:signal transduction histidine kinase